MSSLPPPSAPNNGVPDGDWLNALPKALFWEEAELYQWEGFWIRSSLMPAAVTFKSSFHAQNDDVLLASSMKTGTTWLKAIAYCIMTRNQTSSSSSSPNLLIKSQVDEIQDNLAMENPHFLVPTVENTAITNKTLKVNLHSNRLLHTHLPYSLLPDSVKHSTCKIVYIARNPKDTLISMWHFVNSILRRNRDPLPLEKAVDCFCSGVHPFGPFFEHVAEYWRESQRRPEKMLFLKYEDLQSDPKREISKIAEFLGRPFGDERETDEVLRRCSLERLKNLEVNKGDKSLIMRVPNSTFFRKGEVGDWKNYLTPEMEEKINQTSGKKLEPLGVFL